MSTWLYLECLDHTPPLRAVDESGQHHYDLPRIREEVATREQMVARHKSGALWRAYNDANIAGRHDSAAYFARHSGAFLAQHQTCRIGIRDEYGVEYPLTEEVRDGSR